MKKVLAVILLFGIIFAGWIVAIKVPRQNDKKRDEYIKLAEEYDAEGYYQDAILAYEKANAMDIDRDVERQIVMDYLALGDYKTFLRRADTYLAGGPDEEMYVEIIKYYLEKKDNSTAAEYLQKATNAFPGSECIGNLKRQFDGLFTLSYTEYMDVTEFEDGYSVVTLRDGTKSLVDDHGKVALNKKCFNDIYEVMGKGSEIVVYGVDIDNTTGYFDENGYKRVVSEVEEEATKDRLRAEDQQDSNLSENVSRYIPFQEGDLWGYRDPDGIVMIEPQFEEALGIADTGYGWVKQRGTWEIITIYSIKGEDSIFEM